MDLSILKLQDNGNPSLEVLILSVDIDTNLNGYAVCDNTYISGTTNLSNERRNFFWFPNKGVKAGELVALWTRPGKYCNVTNKAGKVVHYFHWGLSNGVWNNTGDLAILIEIAAYDRRVVNKV
ncbi:hypothetical protein [Methylorubrum sp. SL192]|uniref:hypothetical protein n=1 Tax=Methylorubrum sp. SL192 TaxID=2995167 RepID=UPI0022754917|nr:hypothetical protein [Methylorubrum sp. SL192]MCY1642118.1 hypothetical protein [Methylorubrum sp. SL192]